jgi:hypothetical protein
LVNFFNQIINLFLYLQTYHRNGYPATGNRKVAGIGAGKRWREEYEWIAGLSS